jgi:hypothetical protein
MPLNIWKRDSTVNKAQAILEKMLLANEIDPSMSPACVYKLSPEFQNTHSKFSVALWHKQERKVVRNVRYFELNMFSTETLFFNETLKSLQ